MSALSLTGFLAAGLIAAAGVDYHSQSKQTDGYLTAQQYAATFQTRFLAPQEDELPLQGNGEHGTNGTAEAGAITSDPTTQGAASAEAKPTSEHTETPEAPSVRVTKDGASSGCSTKGAFKRCGLSDG